MQASPPPNIAYILRVMILEGNGLPTEACGMLRSPKMAVGELLHALFSKMDFNIGCLLWICLPRWCT